MFSFIIYFYKTHYLMAYKCICIYININVYVYIYIYIYIYIYSSIKNAINTNCLTIDDPLLLCNKVVWCRHDYIKKANKQWEDKTVYKDIDFKETILLDLVHKSNRIFTQSLYTESIHRFFTHANLLWRKNSNTFPIISKKHLI